MEVALVHKEVCSEIKACKRLGTLPLCVHHAECQQCPCDDVAYSQYSFWTFCTGIYIPTIMVFGMGCGIHYDQCTFYYIVLIL